MVLEDLHLFQHTEVRFSNNFSISWLKIRHNNLASYFFQTPLKEFGLKNKQASFSDDYTFRFDISRQYFDPSLGSYGSRKHNVGSLLVQS